MTNKEILRKAIIKAQKNSYNGISSIQLFMIDGMTNFDFYRAIIFSHDFSKAFWGYKKIVLQFRSNWTFENDLEDSDWMFAWKYYLRKMVLEKEPLKYLEKYL